MPMPREFKLSASELPYEAMLAARGDGLKTLASSNTFWTTSPVEERTSVMEAAAVGMNGPALDADQEPVRRITFSYGAATDSSVHLESGRRVAYMERGVDKDSCEHTLIVLHGVGSSRLAGMPGVQQELLEEFGVRLISIDRPGYGRSDPDVNMSLRSFAQDLAQIADALGVQGKFFLLGFSGGGAYSWAAARYIPERLAGIALWAPSGNPHWKGITLLQRLAMHRATSNDLTRVLFAGSRSLPRLYHVMAVRMFATCWSGLPWFLNCKRNLSQPDKEHLSLAESCNLMVRDNAEALAPPYYGLGLAMDVETLARIDWEFEPADVADVYEGPIHIFQGSEDVLVAPPLQLWVKTAVPDLVRLYHLEGEGHLSPFCFNQRGHRMTLEALLGRPSDALQELSLEQADAALREHVRRSSRRGRTWMEWLFQ